MMRKEIILGGLIALIAFLGYIGFDIFPIIMLAGIGYAVYYLVQKKGMVKNNNIGVTVNSHSINFNDIGGQNPAKLEIQEALEFMLKLEKFKEMGIRPLKGILLTGPPGTGKTLLAKASATYTDSVFVAASGSEFIEMYAGVGAQRVRNIFESARQQARKTKKSGAVIFIDEIEVLGGKRGSHTSHLEYDQTLNQLLVEMDGIKNDEDVQVLIIGATNRADLIDSALLRPGRFDRVVNVDLPDVTSRKHILKIHTGNKPLSEDLELSKIAQETFGFSGAQLESVCNEAAIYAMREGEEVIYERHFKEAVDKVMMGEKAEKKPTPEEKKRIAYHESGHALVSELTRSGSVSYVTITSRGNALGYMRQAPDSDKYLYTKEFLLGQINICLGGALTEEMIFGNRSSGATGDFQQAVSLAKQIIECGLSGLGIIDTGLVSNQMVHEEMQKILKEQETVTKELINKHARALEKIVKMLLEKESISGDIMREILEERNFYSIPAESTNAECLT